MEGCVQFTIIDEEGIEKEIKVNPESNDRILKYGHKNTIVTRVVNLG